MKLLNIAQCFLLLVLLITLANTMASAKDIYQQIQQELTTSGFEDVFVTQNEREIVVSYENRQYRAEMRAMGVVLAIIVKYVYNAERIILIPSNRNIPLVEVEVNLDDYIDFMEEKISLKKFATLIRVSQNINRYENFWCKIPRANNVFWKPDLTLKPGIKARFHTPKRIAHWKISLVPELSVTVAKGMQFMLEGMFPLYYEFDKEENQIRFGRIIINHTFRFPDNFWFSTSLGIFDRERYGISVEVNKFWRNGKIGLTTRIDYTGYLNYDRSVWYYSDLYNWSYFFRGSYRFSVVDFTVGIGWGRYLYDDRAWRVDVLRSFGEFDLGFYGIWSDAAQPTDFLAGLTLSIPLPFIRWRVGKRLRLNTVSHFPWYTQYHTNMSGVILKTGNSVDAYLRRLFPTYVRNNLEEFIKCNSLPH